MHPDDYGCFQVLAPLFGTAEILPEPLPGVKTDAQFIAPLKLHAVKPQGFSPCFRITGHTKAGSDIRSGINREMGQNGKPGQVNLIPLQEIILKRSLADPLDAGPQLNPAAIFRSQVFFGHSHGHRQATAGSQGIGHYGETAVSNIFKNHHRITVLLLQVHHQGTNLIFPGNRAGYPHNFTLCFKFFNQITPILVHNLPPKCYYSKLSANRLQPSAELQRFPPG